MRVGRFVASVLYLIVLAACGAGGGGNLSDGAATEEYWFDSLPEMVATSDVVVLGTVVDVRDGLTEGPPGEEIEHTDAVLKVNDTLYGSTGDASELEVQTLKFVSTEPDWRAVDNTVLAFLRLSNDPADGGRYYAVNGQSVFLVSGQNLQPTVQNDSFTTRLAGLSLDDIKSRIAQAGDAIDAGRVTPQAPAGG